MRIIVSGLVGLYPVGGVAWDYLQYVIGLARLGHEVYYHEDTWGWPYHPIEKKNTDSGEYSANFIGQFFSQYSPELQNHWHYWHLHKESFGMDKASFNRIAETADIFLNISGANNIPDNINPSCIKIFLDTDPGYNQIVLSERFSWSENAERWGQSVKDHDQHYTYAENINGSDCIVPKLEFNWKTTRMPVILDLWKRRIPYGTQMTAPWTTIMTWNAFKGKLIYQSKEYKSKDYEFEKFIDLPTHKNFDFILAVGGKTAPLQLLRNHGWNIVDGPETTLTPTKYHDFISSSKAEFSIAKHVYVAMQTGWFSCRSACYLAAGKPIVIQDTGFSKTIPSGEGLFAFTSMEEAVNNIQEVENNYEVHSKAASKIAEDFFDSNIVLDDMIVSL